MMPVMVFSIFYMAFYFFAMAVNLKLETPSSVFCAM